MIDYNDKINCVGCSVCFNVCNNNAIKMVTDSEGFLKPIVDEKKCCNCGLCDSVCQINVKRESNIENQKFYALIHNDYNKLKNSSSGGAFLSIAEYVFKHNGIVVGCAFDTNLVAQHIITYNLKDCIEFLCGSKYVQSDLGVIYSEIKSTLQKGTIVLFVGTPCQVNALILFLRDKPENLITIDLICHGVSSPVLWKKHKEYIEHKLGSKINSFRFRGKEKEGWALYYYYYYGEKNKCKHGPSTLDHYYSDFLKGINYRESCYKCKFADLNRVGDFTIGDFWGAEKFLPKGIDIQKGVSLVIVNNQKAIKILYEIKNIDLFNISKEMAVENNRNLLFPTMRPNERDKYYDDALLNFDLWEIQFTHTKEWRKNFIKSKIPVWIKKLIRR